MLASFWLTFSSLSPSFNRSLDSMLAATLVSLNLKTKFYTHGTSKQDVTYEPLLRDESRDPDMLLMHLLPVLCVRDKIQNINPNGDSGRRQLTSSSGHCLQPVLASTSWSSASTSVDCS